jgi:hypothetical protein
MMEIEYSNPADSGIVEPPIWSSLPEELSNPSLFVPCVESNAVTNFFVGAVATSNDDDIEKLLSLPQLSKSPVSLPSLYARIWTTITFSNRSRTTALVRFTQHLSTAHATLDFQGFIPHLIAALSDASLQLREAAATAVVALQQHYLANGKKTTVVGLSDLYAEDSTKESELKWLSMAEALWVLQDVLLPKLPECKLDSNFVVRLLGGVLNRGGKKSKKDSYFLYWKFTLNVAMQLHWWYSLLLMSLVRDLPRCNFLC